MKQLAAYLGYTPQYVSMVLNGKKSPDGAEQLFSNALDALIEKKGGQDANHGRRDNNVVLHQLRAINKIAP